MHPYEISSTLRERGKEQSIKLNYGSLYSVVEALQRHKLIEARETVREGRRPERTVYEITAAGQAEFEDWLAELLSTPVKEYTSLEAGLSFLPALPPDEAARLLRQRVERLRIELAGIDGMHQVAREGGLPELFLVESLYRRAIVEAELAFVARLAEDIAAARFPGTKLWARMHELLAAGVSFEEIGADPVGHLGEEARILQQR